MSVGGFANGRKHWSPSPRSERAIGRLYRGPAPAGLGRSAAADRPSQEQVDETRRNVLKLLAVAGVLGAVGGGLGSAFEFVAKPPAVGLSRFPEVQLQDLDGSALTAARVLQEYNVGTTDVLAFDYPLSNEPNLLINLAGAGGTGGASGVPGGVGPSGSIVAFSAICQHLGCAAPSLAFYPAGTCAKRFGPLAFYIHCSCHGSTYDPTAGAVNLSGPATRPLPQVTLQWNRADDTLWAVGVTGPTVMGHSNTLQGGVGVGSSSRLQRQSPVVLCNFP